MRGDETKHPETQSSEQPTTGEAISRAEAEPSASEPEARQRDNSTAAKPAAEQPARALDVEPSDRSLTSTPVPEQPTTSAEPEAVKPQEALPDRSATEADTAAANEKVLAISRQGTRRSFLFAGLSTAAAYVFYHYLGSNDSAEMQPSPLRDAYRFNASVSRDLFRNRELAPTYPIRLAENLRINGIFGLKKDLQLESWRLQLVGARGAAHHPWYVEDVTAWEYHYKAPPPNEDKGHDTKVDPRLATANKMAPESKQGQADEDENHTGRKPRGTEESGESDSTLPPHTPGLLLRIEDITGLPRHELVTQFKCIEGWSQIVHWAGVRMADFLELYPPENIDGKDPRYVYMETPDGDYYTGYDLDVMRHPQTLLVTEMMGAPLTQPHGAPLRLHMPTKYGYKQIKRIGLIAYTNDKPDDYWTKLGYDWYAGL